MLLDVFSDGNFQATLDTADNAIMVLGDMSDREIKESTSTPFIIVEPTIAMVVSHTLSVGGFVTIEGNEVYCRSALGDTVTYGTVQDKYINNVIIGISSIKPRDEGIEIGGLYFSSKLDDVQESNYELKLFQTVEG